ncbi:transcriptional regulator [Mycolicibacterium madagascariense]|uniref:Transcriptional regulator n=1 Tax=Mycolicibacterium madagascariense TaxID=212765 RepID=A0A7I7XKU9_9MYCO|nr:helix-turn-helix domain-containing protein [Mycolicibacterium madagascariense]MCV7014681.1 AraC family transcriptional regulator [Mycolicibacterium madagascariense]BBZ29816.1 transcriptional regulator [Mycolicibacterium madagascariense]
MDAKDRPQLGVVGRANTAEVFDLDRWAPSDDAAPWVEHFWSVSWNRCGREPFTTAVLTFPALHLTHEWGEDTHRHGHALPATLLHGVVERVFTTTLTQRGTVVGARFRPGGFTARFGRDASSLTGRVVRVDDELSCDPIVLDDDREGAATQLDRAIAAPAGAVDPTYVELTALLDRMRADATLHRVAQVMAHSPWSGRTTQRVFRHYAGVPVKWVLCRYRLQHAALEIESDRSVDFADLAVRFGWYDQAHFSNDFRAMLGCTPGEYATRHG